jgi:3-hydroxyacyl-CoA dehydrogenase
LGKKAGVGWYRYPGGGGKVIDPLVEDLCREEAHFARVPPRDWPQEAIIETLFLTQLLALARVRALGGGWDGPALALLAERVLGFPPGVGGPLGYARAVGWPQVMAALGARSQDAPEFWAAYRALLST